MDARNFPSTTARRCARLASLAAAILAAMIGWALWSGYGGLLPGGHVH